MTGGPGADPGRAYFNFVILLIMSLITPPIKNIMSKVPSGSLSNVEMIVESLRPQLEVTTKDIEPIIIMGLYHHRNLIGSPSAFSLALSK